MTQEVILFKLSIPILTQDLTLLFNLSSNACIRDEQFAIGWEAHKKKIVLNIKQI